MYGPHEGLLSKAETPLHSNLMPPSPEVGNTRRTNGGPWTKVHAFPTCTARVCTECNRGNWHFYFVVAGLTWVISVSGQPLPRYGTMARKRPRLKTRVPTKINSKKPNLSGWCLPAQYTHRHRGTLSCNSITLMYLCCGVLLCLGSIFGSLSYRLIPRCPSLMDGSILAGADNPTVRLFLCLHITPQDQGHESISILGLKSTKLYVLYQDF